jgi:hypothetical protein
MSDLLVFFDVKLNDLMLSLYRTRQALLGNDQQRRPTEMRASTRGDALTSLQEAERALAAIQRHMEIASVKLALAAANNRTDAKLPKLRNQSGAQS